MRDSYRGGHSSTRIKTPWKKGSVESGLYFTVVGLLVWLKSVIFNIWFGLAMSVALFSWSNLCLGVLFGTLKTHGLAALTGGVLLGCVFGVIGCLVWYLINKLMYTGDRLTKYRTVFKHVRQLLGKYHSAIPEIPAVLALSGLAGLAWDNPLQIASFVSSIPTAMFNVPIFFIFFGFMLGIGAVALCWEYHLIRPLFRQVAWEVCDRVWNRPFDEGEYVQPHTVDKILRWGWRLLWSGSLGAVVYLYSNQLRGIVTFILHGGWDSIYLGIAFGGVLAVLLGLLYGGFYCWNGTATKPSFEASEDFWYRMVWKLLPGVGMGCRHLVAVLLVCLLSPWLFGLYPFYFLCSFYTLGVGHNGYVFWLSVAGTLWVLRFVIRAYWYSNEVYPWLVESLTTKYFEASLKNCGAACLLALTLPCLLGGFGWIISFVMPLVTITPEGFWVGFILGLCTLSAYISYFPYGLTKYWWFSEGLRPRHRTQQWTIWPYFRTHRRLWYIVGGVMLFCVAYPLLWVICTHCHVPGLKILIWNTCAGGAISVLLSMYCGFMFGALLHWVYWMWPFLPTKIYWLFGGVSATTANTVGSRVVWIRGGRKRARTRDVQYFVKTLIIKRRGGWLLRAIMLPHHKPRKTWM